MSIKNSNFFFSVKYTYLASTDATIHTRHLMEHSAETVLATDLTIVTSAR